MKGFDMNPLRDTRNPWRQCQFDDLIDIIKVILITLESRSNEEGLEVKKFKT